MKKQTWKYIFSFILLIAVTASIFYFSKPVKHNDSNTRPSEQVEEKGNQIIPKEDPKAEEEETSQQIETFHIPKDIYELATPTGEKESVNFKVPERRVVLYWASWCEPCHTVVQELNKLEADYPNVKFYTIVGIDGEQETIETATKAVKDLKVTIPTYFDENLIVHNDSQIRRYSAIAIQDQKGKTLYSYQGGFDLLAVKQHLETANK
ncbi:TlpA family protein disulfide reductase [Atopobacter phocae]|uniref:TlpA family protein disulfide reductase n=1 Tax=Atopobacter phocae TaxID=136492 RepID=UPI00046F4CBA|nr:TlpA disulfide reductase family protein [Atopobacter phocae]